MPGLWSRIKTWSTTEDVTASDINAEFDNILTNFVPLMIDDYSTNTTQMQVTTDPGESGTESLATTLAGELARLRFVIKEITGEDYWYESPVSSLTGLANAIGSGSLGNRLVSGRVLTTSAQPAFLVPNGAARTVKCDGTPTTFIYYVNSTEYSITSDVTLTGLTAAPSSQNTCLINDALATADEYWTKYQGEDGTEIPVDNMGTEIQALVGKYAVFKLAGSATEYFLAYVKSTTSLTKARRGFFFDSTDAPVPRAGYTDNDVITLLKATWVFAKTDGTLTATYNNPVWSDDEPSSPATGDYWYDTSAQTWKVYGVGSYATANATLIGLCAQDTSNTICARSFEFFKAYDDQNGIELFAESNSQVKSRLPGSISVWGSTIPNDYNLHTWDMTLDLESGVTEAASTYYYFYITETGDKVISNKKPHDRRGDLQGYYHPSQSWRCVGWAFNNASSNLEQVTSYYYAKDVPTVRSAIATDMILTRDRVNIFSGASFTTSLPSAALERGQTYRFIHGGTSLTQVYTLDGFGSETIGGSATVALYTNGEILDIMSDGTNWLITHHFAQLDWQDGGATSVAASGGGQVKGTTSKDKIYWRRVGKHAEFRVEYRQTGGGTQGTGQYLLTLPGSLTVDTTNFSTSTALDTGLQTTAMTIAFVDGGGWINLAASSRGPLMPILYSATQLCFGLSYDEATIGMWGSSFGYNQATLGLAAWFTLPISGWLP